jgi:mevalonate kinase
MRASAPGKAFLFGEHAVVYGRHALVTAINLRCYVDVSKGSSIRITSPLGTTSLDFEVHPYVSFAIKRFSEIEKINGVNVKIESEIPVASGLGSSAAVTVATLAALDAEFEAGLDKEDVFELARKVELDVQGVGSGTDPFVSTFGGAWQIPERKPISLDMEFLVVDTGEKSITSEMVGGVAERRKVMPEVYEKIFDAIDVVSIEAIKNVSNQENYPELFRINQALLKAIGVSSRKIEELIEKLDEFGIAAKLTGAGGGGCVIGIGQEDKLMNAAQKFGGMIVRAEKEGVRVEQ